MIPPKEKRTIPVEVTESRSLIQWEFDSSDNDIAFGLFFQDGEEETEILPIHRFCTSDGTEESSYKAKVIGKCKYPGINVSFDKKL